MPDAANAVVSPDTLTGGPPASGDIVGVTWRTFIVASGGPWSELDHVHPLADPLANRVARHHAVLYSLLAPRRRTKDKDPPCLFRVLHNTNPIA